MYEEIVVARANGACELCGATQQTTVFPVPFSPSDDADSALLLCPTCLQGVSTAQQPATNHWRCLNETVWSPLPVVQVVAWRKLNEMSSETWAQDLLEMVYLDDTTRAWAEAGARSDETEPTLDSNGAVLSAGDSVHLIKDLNVKGTSFVAKRGTPVRNISLSENPAHIEGKVNGTRIVIIAAYTKKA